MLIYFLLIFKGRWSKYTTPLHVKLKIYFLQINILTYIFFMMPSLGIGLEAAGYTNILGNLGHVLGGDNGIFLTTWVWKGSILLFMVSR